MKLRERLFVSRQRSEAVTRPPEPARELALRNSSLREGPLRVLGDNARGAQQRLVGTTPVAVVV